MPPWHFLSFSNSGYLDILLKFQELPIKEKLNKLLRQIFHLIGTHSLEHNSSIWHLVSLSNKIIEKIGSSKPNLITTKSSIESFFFYFTSSSFFFFLVWILDTLQVASLRVYRIEQHNKYQIYQYFVRYGKSMERCLP